MSTIQERLQIKRVPLDKWSIREQLCLASAVARSGDQNWSSVSRSLKPFAEPNRPADWFSQKNCAAQYGSLLENVETPKRKKRLSGQLETGVETPSECILRKLCAERKAELKKKIEEERLEYFKLKEEIKSIKQGTATDQVIEKMCQEIELEKKQKEQEALAHTEWLKQRELRKMEQERVFRPMGRVPQPLPQKRKAPESLESIIGVEPPSEDSATETPKPALSPLLTSLLKTPSSLPNVSQSFLHSAITSPRVTSPTIASLLNSNTSVPVSPGIQQLVSTAINPESTTQSQLKTPTKTGTIENFDVQKIEQNIKIEIKEEIFPGTDSSQDNLIGEIKLNPKNQEIEECFDIVDKLVDDLKQKDKELELAKEKEKILEIKEELEESSPIEINVPEHDVYAFDESSNKTDDEKSLQTATENSLDSEPDNSTKETDTSDDCKKTECKSTKIGLEKKDLQSGSVEIVEVVVMEDEDSDKETTKKLADSLKSEMDKSTSGQIIGDTIFSSNDSTQQITSESKPDTTKETVEIKEEPKSSIDLGPTDNDNKSSLTPDYSESFFDMAIEGGNKSSKAKRVYSRSKKKEDIDILLAVEKAVSSSIDEQDITEETGSEIDSQDSDKKSDTSNKKLKDNQERSNSPWTEEDISFIKSKRRYSTPATPIDSVPSSPASSTNYDDDRDYKAWKKSVMFVYNRLAAHKYASLFLKPITEDHAPGYHSVVYRPMDLQTIRKNLENGTIKTTAEFHRDVLLMFNNAVMYNKSNDHIYNMVKKMQQEGLQEIQLLFQVQAPVETPLRRETRTSDSGIKRKRTQEDLIVNKKRRNE